MRLSSEQLRERFEREVTPLNVGIARGAEWQSMLACALRLATDLQAPPTGEEVERAREDVSRATTKLAYNAHNGDGSQFCESEWARSAQKFREAVAAYGVACHAAGRAEGGKAADVLAKIREWSQTYGAELVPGRHGCADTFGEGMRTAKAQIAAALDQLATETGTRP